MFLMLFQYTPAGKPPSIAVHRTLGAAQRAARLIRKCSKMDTHRRPKTLHKAKNCRYFQRISDFPLLS